MKYFIVTLTSIILFVMQTTFAGFFGVFGASLNFMLPYVVAVSVLTDDNAAALATILAGLLVGYLSTKYYIPTQLIFFAVFVTCRGLDSVILNKSLVLVVTITAIATFVFELFNFFIYYGIWGNSSFAYALFILILPKVLASIIATIPIYFIGRQSLKSYMNDYY